LVILSSYVEVLKDIKLIAQKNGPISVCHHDVVKEDL